MNAWQFLLNEIDKRLNGKLNIFLLQKLNKKIKIKEEKVNKWY